jgi:hypothetical protein
MMGDGNVIFRFGKVSKVVKTAKERDLRGISFGIPALKCPCCGFVTCPGAGFCASYCYARQARYLFRKVQGAREHNLHRILPVDLLRGGKSSFLTLERWVDNMISDLARFRWDLLRVHDDGDLFSQWYLEGWYRIARAFPDRMFYAYTKSLHLDLWSNRPANFQIIQSYGGRHDSLLDETRPFARVFPNEASRDAAGYVNGDASDWPAIEGTRGIGLVYHGTCKLTEEQERRLAS